MSEEANQFGGIRLTAKVLEAMSDNIRADLQGFDGSMTSRDKVFFGLRVGNTILAKCGCPTLKLLIPGQYGPPDIEVDKP